MRGSVGERHNRNGASTQAASEAQLRLVQSLYDDMKVPSGYFDRAQISNKYRASRHIEQLLHLRTKGDYNVGWR